MNSFIVVLLTSLLLFQIYGINSFRMKRNVENEKLKSNLREGIPSFRNKREIEMLKKSNIARPEPTPPYGFRNKREVEN